MILRLSWPSGRDLPGLHLAAAVDVLGGWLRKGHRRFTLPGRTAADLLRIGERIAPGAHHIDLTDPAAPVLRLP